MLKKLNNVEFFQHYFNLYSTTDFIMSKDMFNENIQFQTTLEEIILAFERKEL